MSNPKKTQSNVPTTSTNTVSKAWHDRAAGDLRTWAEGYNPRSERAAAVWTEHRDVLDPLIGAAPAAGVTEARRIASAVLELLAWAMPLVNDLEQALSEESVQGFVRANPTGLGDGALGNIRSRVRRVMKVRADSSTVPSDGADGSETPVAGEETSSTSDAETPADLSSLGYDDEAWDRLVAASAGDAVVAACLSNPDGVGASEWEHARVVAERLSIDLKKARVRRTQHVRTLRHPMGCTLAEALRDLGANRRAATEAAELLPMLDDELTRALLRGETAASAGSASSEAAAADGECTAASRRHPAAHLDAPTDAEATVRPAPGGMPTVSLAAQSEPSENADPATETPDSPVRRRRRKPSAHQMRLALAAANAEREARPASMPDSMRAYICEQYVPREPVQQVWDQIKRAVEATLAASSVRGEDSMRKYVTHLAYFFRWALSVDLPLAPGTLTRENVGRYDTEDLVKGGKSVRQTRRSRLMAMADQVHPDDAPVKGPPLAHRTVAPPYTPAQMAIIRRVARVQPSELLVRQLCLLVGLGAGAGIDSTDIKRLKDTDIIDHGPDKGIEVRVTNLRRRKDNTQQCSDRVVWVLRDYEDLVRIGLSGAKRGHLLLGREAERANVAAAVFSRAVLSKEVPELTQARLRSTWMATHLQRATPLNVLLQAAGLMTARSLVELLEHVPTTTDARLLR